MTRRLLAAVRWGDSVLDAVVTADRAVALGVELFGPADRRLAEPRGDHAVFWVPAGGAARRGDGGPLEPGEHALSLGERATVEWGGLAFELAWLDAPAALARVSEAGDDFAQVLAVTALVQGLVVLAALEAPTPRALDDAMTRHTGVIYLTKPIAPPKPRPEARGAVAAAKPAGTRGGHGPRRPTLARDAGLLGVLGRGSASAVFAPGGLSAGLGEALRGLGGPEVAGDGLPGFGGRGGGPGGPGVTDIGGIGDGRERDGRGPALGPRAPTVLPGPRVHVENISKEEIGRVIRAHLPRFRHCYERSLGAAPARAGKVAVGFTIAPNGQVASASVRESSLGDEAVEACVTEVMRSLRFPAPKGGGVAVVTYPFVFATAE